MLESKAKPAGRPNIILITTDQLRFDGVGCNGSSFLKTPNLDRLAAMGVNFKRAYCTNPVCTPSRVSIITGQQVSRHGSYNIGTQAENTEGFLSSVLTGAGYCTHHIGKAHFYPWDVPSQENRTIESMEPVRDFAGFETAELTIGHSDWGVTGHYERWLAEKGIHKGRGMEELKVHRVLEHDPYGTGDWGMPKKYHSGFWIVDRVKHFLDQHLSQKEPRPFYLNLGFQDPHHPQVLPKECRRIPPECIEESWGSFDPCLEHLNELKEGRILDGRFSGKFGIAGNQNTPWGIETGDQERMRIIKSYYYSMIELLDEQIGELLAILKEQDLIKNTLIVFTSDHGDMLGWHGLGEKGPMAFEDVIKVPFFLTAPGRINPEICQEPVSLSDIFPTLLDYAGIPLPGQVDGCSLKDVIEGSPHTRNGVLVEFKEERDAVRYKCLVTRDWKLVEYPGESFGELYHLREDPGEEVNLYFKPEYLGQKYEMLKEILCRQERAERDCVRPCRC